MGELFTGPINRVGPLHGGFSASPEDVEWGLDTDAWAQNWDALGADLLIGNPPYHVHDIRKFCTKASLCKTSAMGIIPARQGAQAYRKTVEATGGRILATFKAKSCAFIPFKFWNGEATLGQDDGRRAPFEVHVVGWRVQVSTAAGREFGALVQASGAGRWALTESNGMGTASWRGVTQIQRDLTADADQTAATAAHNRARQTRRTESDKTERQKQAAERATNGNTSLLTREGGPWTTLRWWAGDCPTDIASEDRETWLRMARWGMIPLQTTELLKFGGASERSRQAFARKC